MKLEAYIPERFYKTVILHIIKNLLPQEGVNRTPLLLGIHGSSGDGKTFQCESILTALGAKSFLISGGQLESHEAGEPAQRVRTAYLNAGKSIISGETKIAVVLINDVDTGVGSWGEMVQYTINRQTVFGELMHIVDYPTNVEGRQTKRIPIIMTGNDFSKLYEPLTRAGRMTAFEWRPTIEEKVEVVLRIYPELEKKEVKTLVTNFREQPVAFFSHLRTTLIDDVLWEEIQRLGIDFVVNSISNNRIPKFETTELSLKQLISHGEFILNSGMFINHLKRG